MDLHTAGRLWRSDGITFDLDDRLREKCAGRVVLDDDLREAVRVAEDEEGHATELAPLLQPAGEPDALAHVGGQLVREDALHGGHLLRVRLEVRAGGAPAVPPHFAADRRPRWAR